MKPSLFLLLILLTYPSSLGDGIGLRGPEHEDSMRLRFAEFGLKYENKFQWSTICKIFQRLDPEFEIESGALYCGRTK